jgi:hypothetical protein
MTVEEHIAVFSSYSADEKKEFVARLMYELTLVARDNYEVGQEGLTNPQRMRRVNEVQHRVGAYLLALIRDNPNRYPDDVLVRIVLEHPRDEELGRQLNEAFARLTAQRLTAA